MKTIRDKIEEILAYGSYFDADGSIDMTVPLDKVIDKLEALIASEITKSRSQYRYQQRHKQLKLCHSCSRPLNKYKTYCDFHRNKKTLYNKYRYNHDFEVRFKAAEKYRLKKRNENLSSVQTKV